MRNGISNFQIEEVFKNIRDEDIKNYFCGCFSLKLHEQIQRS